MSHLPFRHNPKIAIRNARLHRLIRKRIIAPATKAEQRQAGLDAAAAAPATIIRSGKRTTKSAAGD